MKLKLRFFKLRYLKQHFLINILLFIITFITSIAIIIILSFFLTKNKNIEYKKSIQLNDNIMQGHIERSNKHPFHFNDINYPIYKVNEKEYRIIVLGDSFIFGDGLNYYDNWSRKLERKLKSLNPNIQIMHWGKYGFSTTDQIEFLKMNFLKNENIYSCDLFILAYVLNDADDYTIPLKHFSISKTFLAPIFKIFPYITNKIEDSINNFLNYFSTLGYGYDLWLIKLYQNDKLQKIEKNLNFIKNFVESKKSKFLLIITPEGINKNFGLCSTIVEQICIRNNIEHLNLYPKLSTCFTQDTYTMLRANLVNYHPGPVITEKIATWVLHYLKNLYINKNKFGIEQI